MPVVQDLEPLAPGRGTLLAAGPTPGKCKQLFAVRGCPLLHGTSCKPRGHVRCRICPSLEGCDKSSHPTQHCGARGGGHGSPAPRDSPASYVYASHASPLHPSPSPASPHPSKLRAVRAGTQPHTPSAVSGVTDPLPS
ncbi:2-hydroxyhepta-2,4-diene-1,7-dioate isomerase [Platysternon megacephalum]|uniref:2-hydroxyhepta-2,4-diene-1,7-dioate isomerase n=1 Tax=Platysternon megacephalum TaxID=55544 RepID=A0A4D9DP19_9SAUR|nr:2-hydroxyhepta-2,4-diene-1,7-dioate isomerase [Platysternon megacephalum]